MGTTTDTSARLWATAFAGLACVGTFTAVAARAAADRPADSLTVAAADAAPVGYSPEELAAYKAQLDATAAQLAAYQQELETQAKQLRREVKTWNKTVAAQGKNTVEVAAKNSAPSTGNANSGGATTPQPAPAPVAAPEPAPAPAPAPAPQPDTYTNAS